MYECVYELGVFTLNVRFKSSSEIVADEIDSSLILTGLSQGGFSFFLFVFTFTFTFSHLADAFIQSDLQMRTIEAIKTNKKTKQVL